MKAITFMLIAALAGCATKPQVSATVPHEESVGKDTTGALLIGQMGKVEVVVLVSKTGKVLAVSSEGCQKSPACAQVLEGLKNNERINTVMLGGQGPGQSL